MRVTLEKVAAERLQSLGRRASIIQASNNKSDWSDYALKMADEVKLRTLVLILLKCNY